MSHNTPVRQQCCQFEMNMTCSKDREFRLLLEANMIGGIMQNKYSPKLIGQLCAFEFA